MTATSHARATLQRREIPSRFPALPALGFSIGVPADFATPDLPSEPPRFEDPTFMMPLWLASATVALAVITVAVRPAYEDGSVSDWLKYLASQQGLQITGLAQTSIGPHPAILAEAAQTQDGTSLRFRIAALEDGKHLFIVMAMTPDALWPSFGESLSAAVLSFELTHPQGSTAALA